MNREIKFRAWDKINKEMIHFSLFERPTACYGKNCEIMQYTGLKDKNGKEIYEGDVMTVNMSNPPQKDKNQPVVVEWSGVDLRYVIVTQYAGDFPLGNYTSSVCEIIGNIYENPELLTKE